MTETQTLLQGPCHRGGGPSPVHDQPEPKLDHGMNQTVCHSNSGKEEATYGQEDQKVL